MLASPVKGDITFPVLASPKIDGIRCLIIDGQAVSRSLKPIRNPHVQALLKHAWLEGLDGELVVGEPTAQNCMQATTHGVMSGKGEPDFTYYVFDTFTFDGGFNDRLIAAQAKVCSSGLDHVQTVVHVRIETQEELDRYEADCLNTGYEGVMIRSPDGPYKQGRATAKQGYLLKVKRFVDSEAEVVAANVMMHNENEAKRNALGRTERSTAKAGLVSANVLGNLVVEDLVTGVQFEIGTGFTAAQRKEYWDMGDDIIGKIAKYKHFANAGVKDKPRFPVFIGFRDAEDMS